jgi:tetratricopeptide (TPR) repeat protein
MRKGKFDEALDLLKGAELIVNSGKVRVQQNWIGLLYHNFGSVYYSKSEFNKSKIFLLKSLEYEQYSWETHILLGILFFKEGDFEQSANAYKNAITLRSVDPKLFNMLGRTLYALEDYGIALDVFHKGLELAQEQQKHDLVKTINFNIVSCYMALDDPVNARMTLSGMERYVDNIIFKYSLYIYDDIKPLQEIALYDDLIYLLYTSILKSEVKAQFLDKIAALIASSGKEYCDVINEIKDNNFLGIIYPPIAEIENDLSKLYYNKIKNSIEYMQDKMSHSQDCSFSKDLKEEVHNQN